MKKINIILLVFIVNLCSPALSFAQIVSSNILIEQAKEYDGREVEFYGEVVGEVMKRGNFAWINILDNFNAVGIWAKAGEAGIIKFTGDYHHRGDTIIVKGVFHRACPEHGGDLDIHASSIVKTKEGHNIEHVFPPGKNKTMRTLLFLLLAIILVVLSGRRKGRKI